MRAVVQRVREARVTVDGEVRGEIGPGLCVLLGVAETDDEAAAVRLAERVARLRIFNPDGSEAELSGNGAREAIMYLRHRGWTGADTFSIQTIGVILFLVGVVWLLRETIGRGHHGLGSDPVAILDRRLAEGQLSVEEYEQRKKTLTASGQSD